MVSACAGSVNTLARGKLPAKMGRPTKYSEELATRFCEEIVKGRSINELCASNEFPSDCTIYRWFHEHADFRDKYSRARELQADILADEVIPIVNGERPVLNKLQGVEVPNLDSAVRVSRDTLRAKYFAWKAGRMSPRKWGDEVDGTDMGGIAPPILIIRSSDDVRSGAAPKANRRKEHQRD
jgi:hypothetical protein